MNQYDILTLIDILRLVPLLTVFLYAGYQDYKTGEVSNKTWTYTAIGATITLAEYILLAPNILINAVASALVCIIIAYALFKIPYGWGGADAKALITLALCYPLAPAHLAWLPLYPMLTFAIASIIATIAMVIKRKKQIRFLPYVCIGLVITTLL